MSDDSSLPNVPLVSLSAHGGQLSAVVAGAWRMAEWQLSVDERVRWIEQCLELGVTSFDHADIYGNYSVEGLFGEALRRAPALRGRMQLVTKCGIKLVSDQRPEHSGKSYDTSRAHIIASVDRSLEALGTDHIDVLLIHRPDVLMNPEDVAETFARLRDAGKVLNFGVSNHSPSQFALLDAVFPLVTNQVELSPLALQVLHDGTLDQTIERKRRPMIWSPLGGGRLLAGTDVDSVRVQRAIASLARARGVSPTTVAFAWILRHPSRPIPITGTRRLDGIRESVRALDVELTSDEWYSVWEAGAGREVP